MADVTLTAETREQRGSRPAGRLRRAGLLPAVVYGLDRGSVPVTVPARELQHILAGESGANTLIALRVDGEEQLTLARQIQRDPVRGSLVHVDFVRVSRDVAVSAEVPIHLTGESVGVRDGGLLEQLMFHLAIEAKPADIPVAVEADVSGLALGDQLHVSDLVIPAGVVLSHDADELVAQVVAPRGLTEAEVAAAEAVEAAAAAAEAEAGPESAEE